MYSRGSTKLGLAVSIFILSYIFQQFIIHAQPVTKNDSEYQEYHEYRAAPVSKLFK